MTGPDPTSDLAQRLETARPRLLAIAHRMLGSRADAEDAVQEAWLRLHRQDGGSIDNLDGWLTTVVSRVCLDQLRRRRAHPEAPLDDSPAPAPRPLHAVPDLPDPHAQAELAEDLGAALLVVLETLGPAERLAFVLHDTFGVPFADIAEVLGTTTEAARQHASRARRKVRGGPATDRADDPEPDAGSPTDVARQRAVVAAFLAAARAGDFQALLDLLAPDAVVRADAVTVAMGGEPEGRGAHAVAATFSGKAYAARTALLDGVPGLAWSRGGVLQVAFRFSFEGDRVVAIDLVADPAVLADLAVDYEVERRRR